MDEAKQKAAGPGLEIAAPISIPAILGDWLLPSAQMQRRLWPLAIGISYIALVRALGGFRADHMFIGMLCILDFYNEKTRLFLKCFLPFILTGVVFDSMRYFYWPGIAGHVHVEGPYYRDLSWFGIDTIVDGVGKRVTPNEYFKIHTSIALDLLCGFAYLVFVGEYLLGAFLLFFGRDFSLLRRFGWSFLTVNVMGFITYFIYPAAPPWYVDQYGLGPARMNIQPNAAAAHRFDVLLGTHFFDQIYGRGVDVYGAYPSLHVAYPFLTACATFMVPALKWARIPAIAFYFLMCLSAVYLQHHYVVDILLGTTYAIICWALLGRVFPSNTIKEIT
ncbi:MAG: phosphatase PAP2 family protein [Oligoflexia bacterium]|nr:phosphatase PAP2 family protein [Oligoflexia bacterium]